MRRTFAIIAVGLPVALLHGQGPTLLPPDRKEPAPLVLPPTHLAPLEAVKKEREALAKDREVRPAAQDEEDATSAERRLLRKRLEELLLKLNAKPAPAPRRADVPDPRPPVDPPRVLPTPPVTDPGKAVDVVARAINLYREGSIQAALGAFELVDLTALTPADRAFVLYMTAGCYRRLNNLVRATELYNDILVSNADPFYVECANWQVNSVRWRQDLDKQLSDLRQRREAVPPK